MRDNKEGGSRDPVSTHGDPATAAAPIATSSPEIAATEPFSADEGVASVSADMHQFIGRQLRAVFDDVAKQPVPDRFLELMKQLDDKTARR